MTENEWTELLPDTVVFAPNYDRMSSYFLQRC